MIKLGLFIISAWSIISLIAVTVSLVNFVFSYNREKPIEKLMLRLFVAFCWPLLLFAEGGRDIVADAYRDIIK